MFLGRTGGVNGIEIRRLLLATDLLYTVNEDIAFLFLRDDGTVLY